MSLINDALKRAKDAQQKSAPAAPSPQFRPAEPAPAPPRTVGLTVPLIVAVFAVIALLIVWKNQQKTAAREVNAPAKPAAPVNTIAQTQPPTTPVAVATPAPPAPIAPPPTPVTVAPVALAPAPELRLQAIFFAPGHSSAIISGKTVHVGNIFKGFRVADITETGATLVSGTQTNVMTLEQ
jgi:hypothetical protein